MTLSTLLRVVTAALAISLCPQLAGAQACPTQTAPAADADAAEAQVRTLLLNGCLGETKCEFAVCKKVGPVLTSTPTPAEEAEGLRAILAEAVSLDSRGDYRTTVVREMSTDIRRFEDRRETAAARWQLQNLRLFADEAFEVDVVAAILAGCSGQAVCSERAAEAAQLVTVATLFERLLLKAKASERKAFVQYLTRLDAQWTTYLGSARGQYPWELLLNSALYRKTAGFDRPPGSQWVLLHPGAAFEVVRNGRERNPSQALILELLGWQRWTWEEDAKPRGLGGSLALSWRDAGDGRRSMGYGALIYLAKGSTIGYVWRPQNGGAKDEHALVLSADIVKFFNDREAIKSKLLGGQ